VSAATISTKTVKHPERSIDWGRYTQQVGIIAVLVVLGAVFQFTNPDFLSSSNLIELLRSATLYFMVACPMTLILVAGALDFSAGAVYAIGAVISGTMMVAGVPWAIALLAGVGVGIGIGLVTGALGVYLKLPSLIASLAVFFIVSGVSVVMTNGQDVYGFPEAFTNIGGGNLFGVPNLIYIAIIVGFIFHVLLEKTPFGYNVRAMGGNRTAAAANGIHIQKLDLILFATLGGVTALAGLLAASRLFTASPSAGGTALTFQVVTAVIIGGTSLFGGIGTITGSALGALLFAAINNGLALANVNPLYQNIFIGIILAAAVTIDQYRRARRFKAGRS
jgi:ribose transport system permease protein